MTKKLSIVVAVMCVVAPAFQAGVETASSGAPALGAAAEHAECSHLVMLRFPDVKITAATSVAAAASGAVRVAHCRVEGVIGSEIKFQLLLPDEWNHKFLMGGGGGYVAGIDNQFRDVVNAGYATVGTDTGHQGFVTDASWALDNWERQINFGYLAVHRTAEVAKAIVRSYYSATEAHDYFAGCSNGGRQALMEAQRFPDDFDGVVAGAPALDFVGIAAQFIKDIQAAFPDGKTALFTPDVVKSVGTQILERCDAIDGVKDGVLDDPRKCAVDLASLTGLTDAQKTALRKIYAPTGPVDHPVYPGQPFGGETEGSGWPAWITGGAMQLPQGPSLRYAFGTQFFKYFVFGNPSWDYTTYDVGNAPRDGKHVAAILNANNPDLSAFKSKGHKLILWHGWADAGLTPLATVKYYEEVNARDANAPDYTRLFMMPGVLHCTGGPGPDSVDWAATIDAWVDGKKAPDRVIARKTQKDQVARTRPLCPYPQHAVYSGNGSTDEEKNFACR